MAMRTNLRQQLLKEQAQQQPQQQQQFVQTSWSAASQLSSASSGLSGGAAFSRLENPTPYHLAQQQQHQQQLNQSGPVTSASGCAAVTAASASSPLESPDNSADSDLQLPNDMELDLDISELLGEDHGMEHLSSTVPNQAHFPAMSSGQTFSCFTGVTDDDATGADVFTIEAKPSTSAPASTHLFFAAGGSRLSAHQLQQQQQQQQQVQQQQQAQQLSLAPASLGSSDSRAASVASSLATTGLPRDRSKKDSHNRIERKRRENINYQIAELGEILPRGYFQDSDMKKNKGNILKASVDYIRELQADQVKLSDRVAQSESRAEKLDQLSRALAVQIQNMQQALTANGVQYQQANSLDEGVFHGLLNFLVSSGPPLASRVKSEPTAAANQRAGDPSNPTVVAAASAVAAVSVADATDSLTLGDADPMFGISEANSPLFSDQ